MTKQDKAKEKDERIPFDDALKRILAAPPMPKTTATKKVAKAKKRAR